MAPKPKQYAAADSPSLLSALWRLYAMKLSAVEQGSIFDAVVSMPMTEAELFAPPTVMLVGQYSTGKTTLIRWLLESGLEGAAATGAPEEGADGAASASSAAEAGADTEARRVVGEMADAAVDAVEGAPPAKAAAAGSAPAPVAAGPDPFPWLHVGPEPTTDGFMVIQRGAAGAGGSASSPGGDGGGSASRIVPGSAATSDSARPFRALASLGAAFLDKFKVAEVKPGVAELLDNISVVDTPGVLAGTKQLAGRNYDFDAAMRWFAERADMILLLFDAHKVDISDEFKRIIRSLAVHDDKVRLILNKADACTTEELMHVYGGVTWFLAKVMRAPEVKRTYVSSFWAEPLRNPELARFMREERGKLIGDLAALGEGALTRKVNEFIKRVRLVRAHVLVIRHLQSQLPMIGNKDKAQAALVDDLPAVFEAVSRATNTQAADFPDPELVRERLKAGHYQLDKMPKAQHDRHLAVLDDILEGDVPQALEHFAEELGNAPARDTARQGVLLKQAGGDATKWQKRFFVLDAKGLYYFAKAEEYQTGGRPKGAIEELEMCSAAPAPDMDESFCIRLSTLERTYHLAAASAADMSAWLHALWARTCPPSEWQSLKDAVGTNAAIGAGGAPAEGAAKFKAPPKRGFFG